MGLFGASKGGSGFNLGNFLQRLGDAGAAGGTGEEGGGREEATRRMIMIRIL